MGHRGALDPGARADRANLPGPPDEFDALYLARLEKRGAEKIGERFAEVHAEYLRRLALLCFEPVGEPCHRRLFAGWWELNNPGEQVPELGR